MNSLDWNKLLDEFDRLKAENARLREAADMACVEPADDCECSGCVFAAELREKGGEVAP